MFPGPRPSRAFPLRAQHTVACRCMGKEGEEYPLEQWAQSWENVVSQKSKEKSYSGGQDLLKYHKLFKESEGEERHWILATICH